MINKTKMNLKRKGRQAKNKNEMKMKEGNQCDVD
jgi:hypothetical protein